jgi:hypothetical protein
MVAVFPPEAPLPLTFTFSLFSSWKIGGSAEAHPLHWLDPTMRQPEPDELPQPGGDSDAGGCKRLPEDHADEQKQDRRQEVAEQLPEACFTDVSRSLATRRRYAFDFDPVVR